MDKWPVYTRPHNRTSRIVCTGDHPPETGFQTRERCLVAGVHDTAHLPQLKQAGVDQSPFKLDSRLFPLVFLLMCLSVSLLLWSFVPPAVLLPGSWLAQMGRPPCRWTSPGLAWQSEPRNLPTFLKAGWGPRARARKAWNGCAVSTLEALAPFARPASLIVYYLLQVPSFENGRTDSLKQTEGV